MIIEQLYINEGWHPWRPHAFDSHYPIDGPKLEYFELTASDYDVGDDQVVCPCGAELYRYPQDADDSMAGLGWAIRVAEKHLAEAHGRRAADKAEDERLSA